VKTKYQKEIASLYSNVLISRILRMAKLMVIYFYINLI